MHLLKKKLYAALASGVLLLGAGSAHAALVNFEFIGDVGFSTGYGGLSAGDTVTVTGIFDDSALIGGTGTILFGSGSGNSLSIDAGSLTFTEAHDSTYALTGASLTLAAGDLSAFDYAAISGINGAPANFDSFFLSFGADADLVGTWQTTVQMAPVPVPAAVWLFGSGLVGLLGVARARTKSGRIH
jgi:hypothetical protein